MALAMLMYRRISQSRYKMVRVIAAVRRPIANVTEKPKSTG